MNQASRTSWKTLPLPDKRRPLGLSMFFTDSEAEQIHSGLVPKEMEDKWFVYFEEGWLYFHRSWTGACIYWLKLDRSPAGVRVVESWINTDPNQYNGTDLGFDRKLVPFIINIFLLGRTGEFPVPTDIQQPLLGVFQHHTVGRAYPDAVLQSRSNDLGFWSRLKSSIFKGGRRA